MIVPHVEMKFVECQSWLPQCGNVDTDITSSVGNGSIDLSNIPMKYTVGFRVE